MEKQTLEILAKAQLIVLPENPEVAAFVDQFLATWKQQDGYCTRTPEEKNKLFDFVERIYVDQSIVSHKDADRLFDGKLIKEYLECNGLLLFTGANDTQTNKIMQQSLSVLKSYMKVKRRYLLLRRIKLPEALFQSEVETLNLFTERVLQLSDIESTIEKLKTIVLENNKEKEMLIDNRLQKVLQIPDEVLLEGNVNLTDILTKRSEELIKEFEALGFSSQ